MDTKRCRAYIVSLVAVCLLLLSVVSATCPRGFVKAEAAESVVTMHFVDVGQGDASFIELPDGRTALIDAGSRTNSEKLVRYINNLNYNKIDILIITHADSDHCGGAATILENFAVDYVFRPFTLAVTNDFSDDIKLSGVSLSEMQLCNNEDYVQFISLAYQKSKKVFTISSKLVDTVLFSSYYSFRFMYPFGIDGTHFDTGKTEGYKIDYTSDTNEISAVTSLCYYDAAALYMGDADQKAEAEMLERAKSDTAYGSALKSTKVLKVAHHGSKTGTGSEFLNYIKPSHALISCGKDNSYGHPDSAVATRLNSVCGAENVYVTSEVGGVIFKLTDGGDVKVMLATKSPVRVSTVVLCICTVCVGLVILTIILITKRKKEE